MQTNCNVAYAMRQGRWRSCECACAGLSSEEVAILCWMRQTSFETWTLNKKLTRYSRSVTVQALMPTIIAVIPVSQTAIVFTVSID
jgi:hypothetical protein